MRIRSRRDKSRTKVWKAEAKIISEQMRQEPPPPPSPVYTPAFMPVQRDRIYDDGVYVDVSGRGPGLHVMAVVCVRGDLMAVVTTFATDAFNSTRAEREAVRMARVLYGAGVPVFCDNPDACRMEDATYVCRHNNLAARNAARNATNFTGRDKLPAVLQLGLDKPSETL